MHFAVLRGSKALAALRAAVGLAVYVGAEVTLEVAELIGGLLTNAALEYVHFVSIFGAALVAVKNVVVLQIFLCLQSTCLVDDFRGLILLEFGSFEF